MSRIAYVTNAPPQSGMGKPAREIARALGDFTSNNGQRTGNTEHEIDMFEIDGQAGMLRRNRELVAAAKPWPGRLGVKPVQWWRLAKRLPPGGYDLWHFTNQTLSFIPRTPAIVTVYDLIELLDPQERFGRLAARFLYGGIPRAAHLICISAYTKKTVQGMYGMPDDRVTVIPLGVRKDFVAIPDVRQSLAYHEFLREQHINRRTKIVLYVGSDHPRKNLGVLAEAFAAVHRELPEAILLKVGDPGLLVGREQFLAALDRLRVRNAVRFIGNVEDKELQFFYSIADVFVFPSTFEGFGIPPLEAMACGCPVVCSNATSLPEVVGDAAVLCDPRDARAFAEGVIRVLTNAALARQLSEQGTARAHQFFWGGIAQRTLDVYRLVLG